MLALDPPASARDEDQTITAMRNLSKAEQQAWIAAYTAYRRNRGSQFKVPQAVYTPAEAKQRRDLYKSRGRSGAIGRLRKARLLVCCAMCGSHHNGTLDHYLPKDQWPEFSILLRNLVPACSLCNSGAKGTTVCGSAPLERFLHPYYDRAARRPLWLIEVQPPYAAPRFIPKPVSTLSPRLRRRVAFHLSEILSDQFDSFIETQWAMLPQVLGLATGSRPSLRTLETQLDLLYRQHRVSAGVNGWKTVLLRGICQDPAAIAYLHSKL